MKLRWSGLPFTMKRAGCPSGWSFGCLAVGCLAGLLGCGSGSTPGGGQGGHDAGAAGGAAGGGGGATGTAGAAGASAGGAGAAGGAQGTAGGGGADASMPTLDAAAETAPAADAAADASIHPKSYACNLILGVSVTYDWFTSGFETYVDGARWEAMAPAQPLMAFIENWGDPNAAVWGLAKLSPCAQNASAPERVIFTGVNWQYTTAAEWTAAFDAVVKVIQVKFPAVRELDLMTMLRAPANVSCGNVETVVQPFIDQAIQALVAKYPALVRAAPKLFAPSCDVFTGGGPHFTTAGKAAVAKVYGDSYAQEP